MREGIRRATLMAGIVVAAGCASGGSASGPAAGTPMAAPSAAPAAGAGHYTSAQSARGEQAFNGICAACHTAREFSTRLFQVKWSGRSVAGLYELVSTTMPFDSPGSLSEQQYADIVAYVLSLNGFPSGTVELTSDPGVLGAISFQ